jgi:hypothetical protein
MCNALGPRRAEMFFTNIEKMKARVCGGSQGTPAREGWSKPGLLVRQRRLSVLAPPSSRGDVP